MRVAALLELRLEQVAAHSLPQTDFFGKCDAYCLASVGPDVVARADTVKSNLYILLLTHVRIWADAHFDVLTCDLAFTIFSRSALSRSPGRLLEMGPPNSYHWYTVPRVAQRTTRKPLGGAAFRL